LHYSYGRGSSLFARIMASGRRYVAPRNHVLPKDIDGKFMKVTPPPQSIHSSIKEGLGAEIHNPPPNRYRSFCLLRYPGGFESSVRETRFPLVFFQPGEIFGFGDVQPSPFPSISFPVFRKRSRLSLKISFPFFSGRRRRTLPSGSRFARWRCPPRNPGSLVMDRREFLFSFSCRVIFFLLELGSENPFEPLAVRGFLPLIGGFLLSPSK